MLPETYLSEDISKWLGEVPWVFLQLSAQLNRKPFSAILRYLLAAMTIENSKQATVLLVSHFVRKTVHYTMVWVFQTYCLPFGDGTACFYPLDKHIHAHSPHLRYGLPNQKHFSSHRGRTNLFPLGIWALQVVSRCQLLQIVATTRPMKEACRTQQGQRGSTRHLRLEFGAWASWRGFQCPSRPRCSEGRRRLRPQATALQLAVVCPRTNSSMNSAF